jgi:hypothetical protein
VRTIRCIIQNKKGAKIVCKNAENDDALCYVCEQCETKREEIFE